MEQINDLLGYNNLKIVQNTDWFKFSLDSVLLANFVTINYRCNKIMDMCTGNAPVPMIMSIRTSKKIIAVEVQKEIYNLACKSININNLQNQITILNEDIKNLCNVYSNDSFDLITCNPPYFKLNEESVTNTNSIKSIARHEILIDAEQLISIASNLLKNGGIFSMVHRPERLIELIELMRKYKIEPKRVKFIYPKNGKDANILLIEGIKNGKLGIKFESPLFVYNDNNEYTDDLKEYINCNL